MLIAPIQVMALPVVVRMLSCWRTGTGRTKMRSWILSRPNQQAAAADEQECDQNAIIYQMPFPLARRPCSTVAAANNQSADSQSIPAGRTKLKSHILLPAGSINSGSPERQSPELPEQCKNPIPVKRPTGGMCRDFTASTGNAHESPVRFFSSTSARLPPLAGSEVSDASQWLDPEWERASQDCRGPISVQDHSSSASKVTEALSPQDQDISRITRPVAAFQAMSYAGLTIQFQRPPEEFLPQTLIRDFPLHRQPSGAANQQGMADCPGVVESDRRYIGYAGTMKHTPQKKDSRRQRRPLHLPGETGRYGASSSGTDGWQSGRG